MVAVDSAGAPGAEALLLRSGRISEDDWTTALRDGIDNDIAALGGIGGAGLRVVAEMAARDAAFAIAAGSLDGQDVDQTVREVLLPVAGGIAPFDLIDETGRRLDALDRLPVTISPYQERVVPVPEYEHDLPAKQREIVTNATGRRTARDIAFAVGRGVYPVTVEISRMLAAGILQIAPSAPRTTSRARIQSLRPRHSAEDGTERNHIGL